MIRCVAGAIELTAMGLIDTSMKWSTIKGGGIMQKGKKLYSYNDRLLRIDLTRSAINTEAVGEEVLRESIGGVSLGMRYLYQEVEKQTQWMQPENLFIISTGPLNGTTLGGTGAISIVTTGSQTGGATESEANGHMGAYLKFCGFDGILIQGIAPDWQYLYISDGKAELRDARHLKGVDTWETETLIKKELGYTDSQMSVFCIGPAGENLVRFAAFVGDQGHVAGHNGTGAVLGAKKLKAVAVARGSHKVTVSDDDAVRSLSGEIWAACKETPRYEWGTSMTFGPRLEVGQLPIRNYGTSLFPQWQEFMGDRYRDRYEMTRRPCWACRTNHCNIMKIVKGPYAGFVGEEPEYEQWAANGPLIGVTDVDGAAVLAGDVNRLGMENNEVGWLVAWVMECYEKGLLKKGDLDGLEMQWGSVDTTRKLLSNIAHRRGFGNILAEGVMTASQKIGGEAAHLAIYTKKGASPRGHDHRARWGELLDTITSNTGTLESMLVAVKRPEQFDLPDTIDPFDPDTIARALAKTKGAMQFEDSMVTCRFVTQMDVDILRRGLKAVVGWDYSFQDALAVGRRTVNLMRMFNLKRGIGKLLEGPSERYSSTPVDGPQAGKSIKPHLDSMLEIYYETLGWDRESGVPLAETLKKLGLQRIIPDLSGLVS